MNSPRTTVDESPKLASIEEAISRVAEAKSVLYEAIARIANAEEIAKNPERAESAARMIPREAFENGNEPAVYFKSNNRGYGNLCVVMPGEKDVIKIRWAGQESLNLNGYTLNLDGKDGDLEITHVDKASVMKADENGINLKRIDLVSNVLPLKPGKLELAMANVRALLALLDLRNHPHDRFVAADQAYWEPAERRKPKEAETFFRVDSGHVLEHFEKLLEGLAAATQRLELHWQLAGEAN